MQSRLLKPSFFHRVRLRFWTMIYVKEYLFAVKLCHGSLFTDDNSRTSAFGAFSLKWLTPKQEKLENIDKIKVHEARFSRAKPFSRDFFSFHYATKGTICSVLRLLHAVGVESCCVLCLPDMSAKACQLICSVQLPKSWSSSADIVPTVFQQWTNHSERGTATVCVTALHRGEKRRTHG